MGYDTAIRFLDLVYYSNSDAERMLSLGRIIQAGLKIIVAGRQFKGTYMDMSALNVPEACSSLFIDLPSFDIPISSTDIREGRTGTGL